MRALTVLAGLIFIVTEGTVESCKFTKLVAFQLILSFWDRGGLVSISQQTFKDRASMTDGFDDVVD